MYSESYIERVKDAADIFTVIQKFVKLKKSGAGFVGLSCFANEKSPSFWVYPDKGFFKDFSSGKGGDTVQFIMDHEGLPFLEAIDWLGREFNIEKEEETPEAKAKHEKKKTAMELLSWAHSKFLEEWAKLDEKHWAKTDLAKRGFDQKVAVSWQIGFAPPGRMLCDILVPKGQFAVGEEAGLVSSKNERNYDFFFDRYLIPIFDTVGRLVGFGGRSNDSQPKYMNPRQSAIYDKSKILFGLNKATKEIRNTGLAYLVEGYWDVIAMHEDGLVNTVASCGTAFSQSTLLKKYTKRAVIFYDGDKAGLKATTAAVMVCLDSGIKPEICFAPAGFDPCDLRKFIHEGGISGHLFLFGKKLKSLEEYVKENTIDGLIWLADSMIESAGEDPMKNGEAVMEVADLLYKIENEQTRNNYLELIRKKHKLRAEVFTKRFKENQRVEQEEFNILDDDELQIPPSVDKEEVLKYGFYELIEGGRTGYWFLNGKSATSLTNFTVKPLFHIYSKEDNKRMVEITNGFETRILELPSKFFISLDQFTAAMFDEGFFITKAGFTKTHLQKILGKIGRQFPLCWELRTLGWQEEGFFAFSNYVYNGDLVKYDERGIATHKDKNFFSPAASNIQAMERKENDAYENDRFLEYRTSEITFSQWCTQMGLVYGDKAKLGVAFAIATLFRDLFFKLEGFFPHLYCYGQAQSGKSVFATSISNLFFNGLPAFNLNQGTDFAFWNRLERFRNCPVVFNEFDEEEIKEEWFRGIKSIYDGEGRERGKNKNKTETQKVKSSLILLGQYLSSKDDGATLMRCVISPFDQQNERSQQLIEAFQKLKKMEESGLSSLLIELLQYRTELIKSLPATYSRLKREMREAIKADGKNYKDRIVNNYCYLLSAVDEFSGKVSLGFSFEEFFDFCKGEIVRLSNIINESNALADFWKTLEFLLDSEQIMEGFDFKIETHVSVKVRGESGERTKDFEAPTKLIFLRLNNIHRKYLEVHRRQKGTAGINEQTLLLYIKAEESYVGANPSSRFRKDNGKSTSTNSFVFEYDKLSKLGVNLERENEDPRKLISCEGQITSEPELTEQLTKTCIRFRVMKTETYVPSPGAEPINRKTFTECFDYDLTRREHYTVNHYISMTGLLTEKVYTDKQGEKQIKRLLEVTALPDLIKQEDEKAESELF